MKAAGAGGAAVTAARPGPARGGRGGEGGGVTGDEQIFPKTASAERRVRTEPAGAGDSALDLTPKPIFNITQSTQTKVEMLRATT